MATRRNPTQPLDVDAIVQSIVSRVAQTKGCTITSCKIPKPARIEVLERLKTAGLEVTKSNIRQPVRTQVRELLGTGAFLPLASLRARLVGASNPEARKTALELVAAGEARLVIRGGKEWVVPANTPAVARDRLPAMIKAIDAAQKLAKSATKKRNGATVLSEDLRSLLSGLMDELDGASRSPDQPAREAAESVVQLAQRRVDPTLGLAFVPAVVGALCESMSLAQAHQAVLESERRGEIELRPESGLGRLSDEEKQRCISGSEGTLLSWMRVRVTEPS